MFKYEMMFIVRPDLEEANIKAVGESMKTLVEEKGAKVVEFKEMGQRELAYTIKNYKNGYYFLIVAECENDEAIKEFNIQAKVLKRNNHYMTYIKSAEMISDLIRLLGATNSFFYFEDIRIYRDHKNMVNRLNNCEQANMEKSMKTCKEQLENINYQMLSS